MSKTFDSNPYHGAKEIVPEWTECDVCNRKLKSKDWNSHRASRKHQENVKNASIPGSATYQPSKADGQGVQNDANQSATPLSPLGDSSGNNKCFNCGQEGHQKADCTNPRDSSNVECRNCNEGESELTAIIVITLPDSWHPNSSPSIDLSTAFLSPFFHITCDPHRATNSQVIGNVAESAITLSICS